MYCPTSCLHTIGLAVLNQNDVLTCIIYDRRTVAILDYLIRTELKSQWPYCQEYWLDKDLGVEVFFSDNCEAKLTQSFQLYFVKPYNKEGQFENCPLSQLEP